LPLLTPVKVNVVFTFANKFTLNVLGEGLFAAPTVIAVCVIPLAVYCNVHGPTPVTVTGIATGAAPLQLTAVLTPYIAVGKAFTVTEAAPLALPAQLPVLTLVNAYVVEAAGVTVTINVLPEALPAFPNVQDG